MLRNVQKRLREPLLFNLKKCNTKTLYNYHYQRAKYFYFQEQYDIVYESLSLLKNVPSEQLGKADISSVNIQIFCFMNHSHVCRLPLNYLREECISLLNAILKEQCEDTTKFQKILFVCSLYYSILRNKMSKALRNSTKKYSIDEIDGIPLSKIET